MTTKRQILVGEISKDRFRLMREISVMENAVSLVGDLLFKLVLSVNELF